MVSVASVSSPPSINPLYTRAAASIPPSSSSSGLTQCFDCDLSRQRRRQVDADQVYILMKQHVVDPVRVKRYVHLLGQLLRLLLCPAPQRFNGEALILQQRDDHPGGQAGAEHADPWKHGSGLFVWFGLSFWFSVCFQSSGWSQSGCCSGSGGWTGGKRRLGPSGWPSTCSQTPAVLHSPVAPAPQPGMYCCNSPRENNPETDWKPSRAPSALKKETQMHHSGLHLVQVWQRSAHRLRQAVKGMSPPSPACYSSSSRTLPSDNAGKKINETEK